MPYTSQLGVSISEPGNVILGMGPPVDAGGAPTAHILSAVLGDFGTQLGLIGLGFAPPFLFTPPNISSDFGEIFRSLFAEDRRSAYPFFELNPYPITTKAATPFLPPSMSDEAALLFRARGIEHAALPPTPFDPEQLGDYVSALSTEFNQPQPASPTISRFVNQAFDFTQKSQPFWLSFEATLGQELPLGFATLSLNQFEPSEGFGGIADLLLYAPGSIVILNKPMLTAGFFRGTL